MNTERIDQVEARAAKHAALSDPSRLRIVDRLTLGDLSPTEIGVALGLPSNLITHHLNVLESVGMVSRSRSEADKRRSYVHLTDDALHGLTPGRAERASRVIFVCTANSARSQLAEAIWRDTSQVAVASAGTRPAETVNPEATAAAARHGLVIDPVQPPRHIDEVRTDGDLVITVCDDAHERLHASDDLHWSIRDPARIGTPAAFDSAFDALVQRIRAFSSRLVAA